MPKFLVDICLDGYETEEEMEAACEEFIHEQLNFSGSSVTILKMNAKNKTIEALKNRSCNNCEFRLHEEGWDPENSYCVVKNFKKLPKKNICKLWKEM